MAAPAYDLPRIRVAALVLLGDLVLLVRHEKDGESYHLLPGGGVQPGETLGAAVTREVAEETGVLCEPGRLLFVNDSIDPDGGRHVVNLTFLAQALTDYIAPSKDARVAGAETVAFEDLLQLDLRPPIAERLVEAIRSGFSVQAEYLGPVWVEPDDV